MERRKFIENSIKVGALLILPLPLTAFNSEQKKLIIGLVTDVHQDTGEESVRRHCG